ncbi:hypothetical protein MTOK_32950 [Mycolicibacterium tokaiense]|nr:hypothetical protein MTOK_32950 [Mycolicibacterium tokaiense]
MAVAVGGAVTGGDIITAGLHLREPAMARDPGVDHRNALTITAAELVNPSEPHRVWCGGNRGDRARRGLHRGHRWHRCGHGGQQSRIDGGCGDGVRRRRGSRHAEQ